MRILLPSLLAGAVVVSCSRAPVRPPDKPVDVPVPIRVEETVAGHAIIVDAGKPSLEEVARDAYADIARGRFALARARLDDYDDVADRCSDHVRVTKRPDGGAVVTGPRGLVVTNASGDIVSHEVIAGCLRYADSTLRIVATETAIRMTERNETVALPREAGGSPEAERMFVSDAWALVFDRHAGEWTALNRRRAKVLRGHDRNAMAADEWLVVDGDKGITMRRADGRVVGVRGCEGELLAAVGTERNEVALHVGSRDITKANGTDTRVCLVREDGSTRKVVHLGSATCGLAQAMPCSYVLAESTRRFLGFGSMRGQRTVVDTTVGQTLSPDVVAEEKEEQPEPWCVWKNLPVPSAVCDVQ